MLHEMDLEVDDILALMSDRYVRFQEISRITRNKYIKNLHNRGRSFKSEY